MTYNRGDWNSPMGWKIKRFRVQWWWIVYFGLVWCQPLHCLALGPEEVLVIANRHAPKGVHLACHYMEQRGIPEGNLFQVGVADKEVCSREVYDTKIAEPIRRYLKDKDPMNKILCLVTVYGMPLKITPSLIAAQEKQDVAALRNRRKTLNRELKRLDKHKEEQVEKIRSEIASINRHLNGLAKRTQRSSLDSELALVTAEPYPLSGWVPNPYFIGFKNKVLPIDQKNVKMVSRLDGPSPTVVRRIIDDSFNIERVGLTGTAFFDARWVEPDRGKLKGYALYDKSIHLAATRVKNSGRINVVVDDKATLFKSGEALGAALYCGWYSLAKYVDAFQWRPGAVGYHIASAECRTLKRRGSQVWCKRMLEEGVAATVGPTSEPYVQAFPLPEIFFGLLVDGRLTLAQCYTASLPFWSWQMVLIGDPLYRPFKMRGKK
jgi:uncharacterized protein (TIGR03790 family)